MRILIWTDAFWPDIGGLEVFSVNLVTGLKRRGHECQVIAERSQPEDWGLKDYEGIPVLGVTFGRALMGLNLRALRAQHDACAELIEKFEPEIIHFNSVMRGAPGFVLQQRRRKRPTVLTLHDNVIRERSMMLSAVLENVEIITTVSESVRRNAHSFAPQLEGKLLTVLNALPAPVVAPAPLPDPPRLLAFGRLVPAKGFDLAVRALAKVAERFPNVTLTIAGDGVEMEGLQALARELGLSERVTFPGWIPADEMNAVINRHSIVLMPSRWQEPFGLVALQAAQMGRPIVAARSGGIPEIVVDGVTGRLFENENVDEFAAALQSLLENPSLCAKLGAQAHEHAEKHFSFDALVSAFENIYRRYKEAPPRAA